MGYSEIIHWLNGKGNYADGVALFIRFGDNGTLLKMFQQEENSFTREELCIALKEIADRNTETPEKLPVAKLHTVFAASADFEPLSETVWFKIDVDNLPPPLKLLWKKKSAITEEQKSLFYKLELYATDSERLKASLRILDIEDERNAMWQKFDKWHETGEYDEPEEIIPSLAELKNKVRTLTVRISKLKSKPHKQAARKLLIQERDEVNEKIKNGTFRVG